MHCTRIAESIGDLRFLSPLIVYYILSDIPGTQLFCQLGNFYHLFHYGKKEKIGKSLQVWESEITLPKKEDIWDAVCISPYFILFVSLTWRCVTADGDQKLFFVSFKSIILCDSFLTLFSKFEMKLVSEMFIFASWLNVK